LPFDRAPVLGVTYFNRKSNYHRVRYRTRWILNFNYTYWPTLF
jgi:hypothetical protein